MDLNNLTNRKRCWVIFQIITVMALLFGCGGGGGGDNNSASSDASLSALTLDGIALDKTFQADQLNYSANVDFTQDSITLTPVAADAGATIRVNGIEVASGSASVAITLDVTAEGGVNAYFSYDGDHFGHSIAISGDTLVVGAKGEDANPTGGEPDNSASYAGAAYVFTRILSRIGVTWGQLAYLKPSNAEAGDQFSTSVAISDGTLVMGAPL